jgi:membrane-associated phospholipid phosphatase
MLWAGMARLYPSDAGTNASTLSSTMPYPFLLLLLIAVLVGSVVTLAARRVAPGRGVTAAGAEAVQDVAEKVTERRPWVRARLDPEVATGLALTVALIATFVGGLVVSVLALLIRHNRQLREIDSGAADWGHAHATHLSTRLLQLVTDLGDWTAIPAIAVVVIAIELRRRPSWYLIPFVLVVTLGDVGITTAIKDLVDRARPTLNPLAAHLGPSFPSGHSSTAAAFYASLALILSRGRSARVRALLIGGAAGIAAAVAASRVLLDVHWVSDVIAGLALGWLWFAICAIAFGGRMLRFGAPAEDVSRGLKHARSGKEVRHDRHQTG